MLQRVLFITALAVLLCVDTASAWQMPGSGQRSHERAIEQELKGIHKELKRQRDEQRWREWRQERRERERHWQEWNDQQNEKMKERYGN